MTASRRDTVMFSPSRDKVGPTTCRMISMPRSSKIIQRRWVVLLFLLYEVAYSGVLLIPLLMVLRPDFICRLSFELDTRLFPVISQKD